jgi:hypothetical protein
MYENYVNDFDIIHLDKNDEVMRVPIWGIANLSIHNRIKGIDNFALTFFIRDHLI